MQQFGVMTGPMEWLGGGMAKMGKEQRSLEMKSQCQVN